MLSKMGEAVTETMGVQVIPIDGKTVRQSFLTASAGKNNSCRQRLGKYIAWFRSTQVDPSQMRLQLFRNYWSC